MQAVYNTRFMDRMFSATEEGDEELTEQVGKDIKDAKSKGSVDTDEVKYENEGNGKVSITDKENGEVTMAEMNADGEIELCPASQAELESFIHPEGDGVTSGNLQGELDETVDAHMDGSSVIAPNLPDGGLNPEAGHERRVEDLIPDSECCDEEKEFSVATDNSVVQRIFSDQEFCERIFSEVIESEDTAKVGDLKIEKLDDDSVVVTSEETGDQAKVTLDDENMEVTELGSKNFSDDEEGDYEEEDDCGDFSCPGDEMYDALHVVGVDAANHVLVDAPEYDEDSANDLVQRLTEQGVQGCQIFDNTEDARDYAAGLMSNLGAEDADDVEEPEQAEFSDHTIYLTKFYSGDTQYMTRLFSEAADGVETSQAKIEDAIENGEEIENDGEVITPIDSTTAIIADKENGEFTKATLDDEDLNLDTISADEAKELTDNVVADKESEKEYSDIYSDAYETKFFSESEPMTNYMVKLFSEEADQQELEDAIDNGEIVDNGSEIITPVNDNMAIVEDKESGEYTQAVMDGETVDVKPIAEEDAEILVREYSEPIYCDDTETKYFSEDEPMTDYQARLFTGDADESDIEDAIEKGEQIERDGEVITPIDSKTAIVEDKENGEFTKAVMDDEKLDLNPISEEEADELTSDLSVEDNDNDEDEKRYSKATGNYYYETGDPVRDKFFAQVMDAAPQGQPVPAAAPMAPAPAQAAAAPAVDPATGAPIDPATGLPIDPATGAPVNPNAAPAPSIETIEDKAVAAVQSIQAAAAEAEATILNAKSAPVQQVEPDLQEAQFSDYYDEDDCEERTFSEHPQSTLLNWMNGNGMFN